MRRVSPVRALSLGLIPLLTLVITGCPGDVTVTGPSVCDGLQQPDEDGVDAPFDQDEDGYFDDDTCGSPYPPDRLDCDDADAGTHPGATERCDGKDNNCDGELDPTEVDADGDTYISCTPEGDWVDPPPGGDCDDGADSIHPDAPETCNTRDDDCDGSVDEGATDAPVWYVDLDDDGHGDPSTATAACAAPDGTVPTGDDCDDADPEQGGPEAETCNTNDDDCDGDTDEAGGDPRYPDTDGDGWGAQTEADTRCEPPPGTVAQTGDCDDTDETVHPEADEICDTLDQDCDDAVDEGVTTPWHLDADDDGHGATTPVNTCTQPEGALASGDDCDDDAPEIHPGAVEACDEADQDCDTAVDEGAPFCGYGDFAIEDAADVILQTDTADGGGIALGAAGDFDRDGLADVLIGAPGFDNTRGDTGRAKLVTGALLIDGGDPETRVLPLTSPWLTRESPTNTRAGGSFAAHVDGRGRPQIFIGPHYTQSQTTSQLASWIEDVPALDADMLLSADAVFTGDTVQTDFGASVAAGGDFNCDGEPDLAVGAPRTKVGAETQAGAVYLFLGPVDLSQGFAAAELRFEGTLTSQWVGFSVAFAGNLDGDTASPDGTSFACDDLVIGAPNTDNHDRPGRVFVVWGNDAWEDGEAQEVYSLASSTVGDAQIGELVGQVLMSGATERSDRLGYSVAGAGDVDGDGLADLLLGAPATATQILPGAAYVVYGDAGRSLLGSHDLDEVDLELRGELRGDVGDQHLGASVASAGDFDGDGHADLLIGAHGWDGEGTQEDIGGAYLFSGGALVAGGQTVINLRTDRHWLMTGGIPEHGVGVAVAGVGDVNDDGKGDILVGSRRGDEDGPALEGRAYLLYGR